MTEKPEQTTPSCKSSNGRDEKTDYRIPLLIGVTGHRDIPDEDVPKIKKILKEQIDTIKNAYGYTPIILITPLAEGADRIAADVALELGIKYIVPLPMPQAEYEKDFSDKKSIDNFRTLCAKAYKCFDLPLIDGTTPANLRDPSRRDLQYHQVGLYVARYSQILFALWDGVKNGKLAGTSQVVRYKIEGVPESPISKPEHFDHPDTGMVYHLITPRKSNPSPIENKYDIIKLSPIERFDGDRFSQLAENLPEELDHLNQEASRYLNNNNIGQSKSYIFPHDSANLISPSQHNLLNYYCMVDALAMGFQKKTRLALKCILALIVLGVFAFQTYLAFFALPGVLALYPVFLGAAVVVYWWAKRNKYQSKYLDYRALAEGLRFQLFWAIAGLNKDVTDHYLKKQKSEINWIREAIKGCLVSTIRSDTQHGGTGLSSQDHIALIRTRWIEDQYRYFSRASNRDAAKIKKLGQTAIIYYSFGLGFAILLFFRSYFPSFLEQGFYLAFASVFVSLFLAVSAAIYAYIEKENLPEQVKQYQRMTEVYALAVKHFDSYNKHNNYNKLEKLLFDLGREALIENSDWLTMHRARPIDPPKG
jgi:hypothetical protein